MKQGSDQMKASLVGPPASDGRSSFRLHSKSKRL